MNIHPLCDQYTEMDRNKVVIGLTIFLDEAKTSENRNNLNKQQKNVKNVEIPISKQGHGEGIKRILPLY